MPLYFPHYLRNEAFDIVDDTDGGHIVADNLVFLHLDDKDLFGIFQDGAGLIADFVETNITTPVAEQKGGIATIVDKDGTVGVGSLGFDDEDQVPIVVL